MTVNETTEYAMACAFCGHESHIIIVAVSMPDKSPVHCPQCGGQIGTVDQMPPDARPAPRADAR